MESLHSQIKRFLWSSKTDFNTIIDRFNDFWKHQIENIQNLQAIQIYKLSTFSIKPLYLPIREQVSSYALKILKDEHRAVELKPNRDLLIAATAVYMKRLLLGAFRAITLSTQGSSTTAH